MALKALLSISLFLFPWPIRRYVLKRAFGYQIHPTARIGFSIILSDQLEMGAGAWIGNLTVCKGLAKLHMGEGSSIGNLNQITGFPADDLSYFGADSDRHPELILACHAAVTERHVIDCTNRVRLGKFATLAGYRCQILTHSIDLYQSRQASKPITIGEYCFVGTGSILLGGSTLPDCCVLGAGSLLNKVLTETHSLYAGVPARLIKHLPHDTGYFQRETGAVH